MSICTAGTTDMTLDRLMLAFAAGTGTAVNCFVLDRTGESGINSEGAVGSTGCRAGSALAGRRAWSEVFRQAGRMGGWRNWSCGVSYTVYTSIDEGVTFDFSEDTVDALIRFTEVGQTPSDVPPVRWQYGDPAKVEAFLEEYPAVRQVIRSIEPDVASTFGSDTEVVLELMPAVEESGHQKLVAWIVSGDEIEHGLAKVDALAEKWSDRIWQAGRGRFGLNIAFV